MGGPVYCFSPMCRQGIETDSGGLQLLVVGSIYAHVLGFPCGSAGKESAYNAGEPGSIPGSGRSPGEEIGYELQYSWTSLVAQLIKNPPAMQETWV